MNPDQNWRDGWRKLSERPVTKLVRDGSYKEIYSDRSELIAILVDKCGWRVVTDINDTQEMFPVPLEDDPEDTQPVDVSRLDTWDRSK